MTKQTDSQLASRAVVMCVLPQHGTLSLQKCCRIQSPTSFAMHEALCGGHQLLTSLCPPILGSLITLCTAWPLLVIDHLLMRWPIMRVCPCGPFQCNLLIREGKKLERHMTPSVTGQVSVGFFFIPGLRGNLSTSGQIDLLSAVCPTSVVRSSISSPLHSRGLVGDD